MKIRQMSYLSVLPAELKREIDIVYRSWQLIIKPSDNIYDIFVISPMGIYYQEVSRPNILSEEKNDIFDQVKRFLKDCKNGLECELECGHSFSIRYIPLLIHNPDIKQIPSQNIKQNSNLERGLCGQSVYFLTLDSTNYYTNTIGLYIPKDYVYIINQLIDFYLTSIGGN